MNAMVFFPITKEGKILEGSLGQNMEKVVKAHTDALWARLLEENAKQEKLERDRTQQITNLISNYVNKDMVSVLEKIIKKEISSIGTTITHSISQVIEKTISSAIAKSFQKGVGDKALNQLEKSISSKLEAIVARQIHAQFQTSSKQALQEALKTSVEASVVPTFEMSCKALFDQIDIKFQNGLDTINSASSITQTLSGQLADGQRKLLAIATNSKVATDPFVAQIKNGLQEMTEDPTKELSRLISEGKFEEAFTGALHRSDVSIVSWLCSKDDVAVRTSRIGQNYLTFGFCGKATSRSRTLPLVKANSKATVETGITSTSLGMLARVGNQPEFSFHQFKTSKSNKLFLASSRYISNSDVLDLVD
ncbi:hypothetical protein JHK85_010722 [Glycine max]|nr:hypothetical protein JHK85_010722 [Glycine max]